MKGRWDFTERKFQGLSFECQHKKCASILRQIYNTLVKGGDSSEGLVQYNTMRGWMGGSPDLLPHAKQVSDAFHHHLRLAKQNLKEHHLLPSVRTGDRETSQPLYPISIYLDNLRSAHNVGSVFRTTEAFSLGVLYLSPTTPTPENKQVHDAAMGASQWVRWEICNDITELRRPLIPLETSAQAVSLYEYIFPESFSLVIGNEEYGCSEDVLQRADILLEIPMRGRKNSLNVANAFAAAASEIVRQKDLSF